ncbi:YjcZ family sporulation protein [Paenibacillus pasadenensis]|nr:YjcZ family sporulation protein [Paenibacillus pasadenensis]MCM3748233.1 YjcZ family sporulation protein [Paenibacillus pasadenensis]
MNYVKGLAGANYGPECGLGNVGGVWTSTGAILVLFILLVIIISSFCF